MLNSADLWVPDGIAPVWIARIKGLGNAKRIPGANLMEGFLQLADKKGFSSFFYGDTDDTLKNLEQRLQTSYPGHKVVGTFSPPFRVLTPEEEDEIVQTINDKRPDVVWVGLGMPKQERWVFEHKDRLNTPVAIGVGAAFRFLAGKVKRVPEWVGDVGLEWAWRFVIEPKKLWRRDFIEGPQFLMHVAFEIAGIKKYSYQYQRTEKNSK
jgi:N-acetylglucosaminyldiphosphoundecaprenol N-acetyl-beta-D-mannosaminyltransferase